MENSCPQVLLTHAAAMKHSARNVSAALSSDLTGTFSYPDLAENPLSSLFHPHWMESRWEDIIPLRRPDFFLLDLFPAHTHPSCPSIAQENMGWHGPNCCQAPG